MTYRVRTTNKFDKSLRKCIKRGLDMSKFREAIELLSQNGKLPPKYKAHKLVGTFSGYWECHIEPDWLLIWDQNDTELILLLIDTGTHSDIF